MDRVHQPDWQNAMSSQAEDLNVRQGTEGDLIKLSGKEAEIISAVTYDGLRNFRSDAVKLNTHWFSKTYIHTLTEMGSRVSSVSSG